MSSTRREFEKERFSTHFELVCEPNELVKVHSLVAVDVYSDFSAKNVGESFPFEVVREGFLFERIAKSKDQYSFDLESRE